MVPAARTLLAWPTPRRILSAESGEEVLALFGAMGRDISAVVTDIRMPGMDGLALPAALRDLGISIPILFVSGFGGVGEAPGPFLPKPFLPDDLLAAVQQLLDDVEGDD
jgi:CheY-like chemotaxis protein